MLGKLGAKSSRLLYPSAQSHAFLRQASTSSLELGGHENYDVVVVGGGPAGLAFVNALCASQRRIQFNVSDYDEVSYRPLRETLKIALVEAGDLSKVRSWTADPDSISNRASSITNVSRAFLSGKPASECSVEQFAYYMQA